MSNINDLPESEQSGKLPNHDLDDGEPSESAGIHLSAKANTSRQVLEAYVFMILDSFPSATWWKVAWAVMYARDSQAFEVHVIYDLDDGFIHNSGDDREGDDSGFLSVQGST